MHKTGSLYDRIYECVRRIPPGRVATYGQIAHLIGTCSPRNVGYAMASVQPDQDVPWHRVINAQGRISLRSDGGPCSEQRRLLEQEGVCFTEDGRVNLELYGWKVPLDLLREI
ncbi:MGMT family protein [bacterium]|nr:MGMT family protein [bacterium]